MTIEQVVNSGPRGWPVGGDQLAPVVGVRAPSQRERSSEGTRFAALFPVSARILFHPFAVLVATAIGAVVAALFSAHYAAAVILLGLVAVFVGRERRFLDVLLLTPNLLAARGVLMGGVVGCAFIASAMAERDSWALLAVQGAMMYWLIVSGILNGVCLSGIPGIRMPWASQRFAAECLRPLALVALAILALELTRQLVGIATGGLDRGIHGEEAARQHFGVWTYFSIFPRLTSSCMFLAPVLWRVGKGPLRVIGLGMVGLLLAVGLSTGSRGLILTPLVYLAVGIYFFIPLRRVPLEMIMVVALVTLSPLVLLMATYRSSAEFRETPGWDVAARLSGFARAAAKPTESPDERSSSQLNRLAFGTQLLGVSDQIVYERTPSDVPHVGFEDFDRILYVWIPKFFMRDKPYLQDGNDIVVRYTGVAHKRSASAISHTCDLFRRFGVAGILLGAPVAALISALFARWIFRVLLFRDALLGILLLQLLLSGFHAEWWGTLLSSSFEWLYAIPKHMVLIYLLVGAARFATGAFARRGLLAYTESE
jgi:hypothetical protein